MDMVDEIILQQIAEERNQSPGTQRTVKYAVQAYTKYCKKPLHKLLDEAEKE